MRYCFIVAFIFLAVSVFGQDTTNVEEEEYRTLLSDDINISGFVGPLSAFSSIDNQFAHLMGGGGGLLFADRILIGGYGLGLTNKFDTGIDTLGELEFGHGGFWLGYIFIGKSTFHPVASVLVGWGTVSEAKVAGYINPDKVDKFYAITPVLELEMNVAQYMRISLGVKYRFISGLSFYGYNDDHFSSAGAFISMKLGWF